MNQHPIEYSNIPDTGDGRGKPPPPEPAEPAEEPEESWRFTDSRIANRPDGISTKAVLASLLMMGALGTGGFLLMHSFVRGDQPRKSPEPATAELYAAAVPGAISATPSLIPLPPPPPSPPSFLGSPTATPAAIQTAPPEPTAATTRPPTVLLHVHVYPFPVFAGQLATPVQGAPAANPSASATPSPEGTSGTNPYDEVPEAATSGARRAPVQANGVPSDNPVGSRE
jgi:hypothetical protein